MTTITIADIAFGDSAIMEVEESGGWNAPEKRSEAGYEYDSFSNREPLEVRVDAWVSEEDYQKLDTLREDTEPFAASIDHVTLTSAKLNDLQTVSRADVASHRRVTIEIREVQEADIETAELSIETPSGSMGSAAEDVEPSFAQPEDGSDGGDDDGDEEGLILGTLSSARERLSGVLS